MIWARAPHYLAWHTKSHIDDMTLIISTIDCTFPLTLYRLVTPCGALEPGQHWFRYCSVPDGTKQLPEPILTNHECDLVALPWGQFHRKWWKYQQFNFTNLRITNLISQPHRPENNELKGICWNLLGPTGHIGKGILGLWLLDKILLVIPSNL